MQTLEDLGQRLEGLKTHTVWGYVRVSSDSQEDNQSLRMQQADIVKYCTDKNIPAPEFVEEVASAAKPLWVVALPGSPKEEQIHNSAPRPNLLMLLTHLRKVRESIGAHQPIHLIVWKLDRLARVDYEQELFFNMFQKDGIRLHSVMPTEDHMLDGGHVKDPARAFTRTVLAAVSQYERAMIELRMTSGMTYKAAQGGYTGGAPPFGYFARNKELVIEPDEAEMVRYIFFIKHKYKLSVAAISQWLTQNKPSYDQTNYNRFKIYRILGNMDLYQGVYRDRFGAVHNRPDLKILPDTIEEILNYDPSQYKRAEGERLSHADHDATFGTAGADDRDLGHGGAGGGEESTPGGLPADPEGDVPAVGDGESGHH